jgi:nicotinamidase-related amidase
MEPNQTYHLNIQPYPLSITLEKTALIVIDMQNDFCTVGGFADLMGHDVRHTQKPIQPIQTLLQILRQTPVTIIHTREGHRPDLTDCPAHKLKRSQIRGAEIGSEGVMGRILTRGSKSHDFVDDLYPLENEIVLDKPGKGAFEATDLDLILRNRGIQHILFAGVTTECCVHTTLRIASDIGYECVLLEDCCASLDPEFHRVAIRVAEQIFGWVCDSKKLLSDLGVSQPSSSDQNLSPIAVS